jgi:CRISPR-associated protein Csx14
MPELELRISLDPRNPGQFFACCGLLELADIQAKGHRAFFEVNPRLSRKAEFVLAPADNGVIQSILTDLKAGTVVPVDHPEPAMAPVLLRLPGSDFTLNWWLNEAQTDKSVLKPWGGKQQGSEICRRLFSALPTEQGADLFQTTIYSTTRLGVDPRSAWNALDAGYSPNEQNQQTITYPCVEALAAVGLQGFRPARDEKSRRLFTYALWLEALPRVAARAASSAPWEGLAARSYSFTLEDRGQGYKAFNFAIERNN